MEKNSGLIKGILVGATLTLLIIYLNKKLDKSAITTVGGDTPIQPMKK